MSVCLCIPRIPVAKLLSQYNYMITSLWEEHGEGRTTRKNLSSSYLDYTGNKIAPLPNLDQDLLGKIHALKEQSKTSSCVARSIYALYHGWNYQYIKSDDYKQDRAFFFRWWGGGRASKEDDCRLIISSRAHNYLSPSFDWTWIGTGMGLVPKSSVKRINMTKRMERIQSSLSWHQPFC